MRNDWEIERSLEQASRHKVHYHAAELARQTNGRYMTRSSDARDHAITCQCHYTFLFIAELPRLASPTLKFRQCRGQPPVFKVIISAPVLARHDRSDYLVDMKIDTPASPPRLGVAWTYLSLIFPPHPTTCTEAILIPIWLFADCISLFSHYMRNGNCADGTLAWRMRGIRAYPKSSPTQFI